MIINIHKNGDTIGKANLDRIPCIGEELCVQYKDTQVIGKVIHVLHVALVLADHPLTAFVPPVVEIE